MVEKGEFRQDLFYRLNVITLEIPSLQQRRDDILLLARMFIKELNKVIGTSITGIDSATEAAMLQYHWPGNVRELRNAMERAMTFAEYGKIQLSDLPDHLRKAVGDEVRLPEKAGSMLPLGQALGTREREIILEALQASQGNKSRAAKLLGLSRSVLYEKISKHRL